MSTIDTLRERIENAKETGKGWDAIDATIAKAYENAIARVDFAAMDALGAMAREVLGAVAS